MAVGELPRKEGEKVNRQNCEGFLISGEVRRAENHKSAVMSN